MTWCCKHFRKCPDNNRKTSSSFRPLSPNATIRAFYARHRLQNALNVYGYIMYTHTHKHNTQALHIRICTYSIARRSFAIPKRCSRSGDSGFRVVSLRLHSYAHDTNTTTESMRVVLTTCVWFRLRVCMFIIITNTNINTIIDVAIARVKLVCVRVRVFRVEKSNCNQKKPLAAAIEMHGAFSRLRIVYSCIFGTNTTNHARGMQCTLHRVRAHRTLTNSRHIRTTAVTVALTLVIGRPRICARASCKHRDGGADGSRLVGDSFVAYTNTSRSRSYECACEIIQPKVSPR